MYFGPLLKRRANPVVLIRGISGALCLRFRGILLEDIRFFPKLLDLSFALQKLSDLLALLVCHPRTRLPRTQDV